MIEKLLSQKKSSQNSELAELGDSVATEIGIQTFLPKFLVKGHDPNLWISTLEFPNQKT